MADLVISYPSFQDAAIIEASEHNTNNQDIVDHINTFILKTNEAKSVTAAITFDTSTLKVKETGGGSDVVTIACASLAASRVYTLPDAGAAASFVMTEGTQTLNGTTSVTGAMTFADQKLKLQETGSTDVITINVASLAASRAYTMPDAGGSASFVMTAGAQTISGAKTFDGQLIGKGTATNDSAAAGYIGEVISSAAVANSNSAATTVWDDLTSISLTAGDWNVTGMAEWDTNGATITQFQAGISTTSGNDTTGLNIGDNYIYIEQGSSSTAIKSFPLVIANYRISLTGTTTVYLKRQAIFSAGTPRTRGYRISARRVR